MNLTHAEAVFIRRAVKDAISDLHVERREMDSLGKMAGLMNIESKIAMAESAWEKLKKGLTV